MDIKDIIKAAQQTVVTEEDIIDQEERMKEAQRIFEQKERNSNGPEFMSRTYNI